jgi:hypothetical protein
LTERLAVAYFDDSSNIEWFAGMDQKRAIAALAALAQETRLELFRLLVTCGPEGLPAGVIAERLGVQLRRCPSTSRSSPTRVSLRNGVRAGS